MRFVTHLLAADLRHHRLLIALWFVVLVAATVVDGLHPILGGEASARNALVLLAWVLWIVKFIVRIVLVTSVVQTHPLVGSDAFWLTRPIPRSVLLVSKAILLVITVVAAPVVAEASLMMLHHVPALTLLGVSIDTTLSAAAVLAILMVAASVTASFSRFALLSAATLGGLALLVAIQLAISITHLGSNPPGMLQPPGPADPTGGVVLFVLAVTALAGVLLVQYGTRSRVRAFLVGIASLVAAAAIADKWPWPVLEARNELPAWASSRSAFQLVVNPASVTTPRMSPDFAGWSHLVGSVGTVGLDPMWSAAAGLLDATLQLGDGKILRSAPDAYPRPLASGTSSDPRGTLEHVLGSRIVLGYSSRSIGAVPLFLVRDEALQNQTPTTGRYRGRFYVQLTQYQIEAALPLTPGASGGRLPYHVVVDRASFAYGSLDVRVRQTDASSSFDRRPRSTRTFFLRNVKTSEAVEGLRGDFEQPLPVPRFLAFSVAADQSGFHTSNVGFRFGQQAMYITPNQPPITIDASWERDAELVVVTSTAEAAVERTLDVPAFPVNR